MKSYWWGTAHAAHYSIAIFEWAKKNSLTVRQLTRDGCPVWIIPETMRMRYGKNDKYCMVLDIEYSQRLSAESIASYQLLLKDNDIPYFDPRPYIKTAFTKEGVFMYLDDNHLNRHGVDHLAKPLDDFINSHYPVE